MDDISDGVDEQSEQSFPASDAPSWSGSSLSRALPDSAEVVLEVRNPSGLHARPAALFVRTAGRFSANVRVANLTRGPEKLASARSLLAVLALGVSHGHTIRIVADGADADDAITALRGLVESGVGELPAPTEAS